METGGFECTFNACYLYALWGAIHDCDWRLVPDDKKEEFKKLTASLRGASQQVSHHFQDPY